MKKIIYLILSFVILIGCISCKENNIDLEDIYYNKLPVYEKLIAENLSLISIEMGGNPIEKSEFILLDNNNPEDVNSDIYRKIEKMLGNNFIKAILFIDQTNSWEYVIAKQYKNSFVSYRMCNRSSAKGLSQYRYKNIILANMSYSYYLVDDYKEVEGCFINKNDTILLGGNDISEVVCPKGIDSVATCAFFNNKVIKSIIMNNELYYISWYAFYGASNLKHVELSDKMDIIVDYAFYNTSLEYIVIPEGVEEIGKKVFNCGNIFLEEYTRPEGWRYDFAVEEAEVYYKGQWEYNEEGIPVPLP